MILKIQFDCSKDNLEKVMKELNKVSPLILEAQWSYQNYVIIRNITNIFKPLFIECIMPKLNETFKELAKDKVVSYFEIGHFN